MHRLHIDILHPLVALALKCRRIFIFLAGLSLFGVTVKERKEVGGGGGPYGNREQERKQHLFPNFSETCSRNTKENPIPGKCVRSRRVRMGVRKLTAEQIYHTGFRIYQSESKKNPCSIKCRI